LEALRSNFSQTFSCVIPLARVHSQLPVRFWLVRQERPAIFAWSEVAGEMVALFFDVKLVAPRETKDFAACCTGR
jgi:hypothetical protein